MSPIYDFTCPRCERREDDVIIAKNGVERICPDCGCRMKRKPSVFHPIFVGSGWTEKTFKRGEA